MLASLLAVLVVTQAPQGADVPSDALAQRIAGYLEQCREAGFHGSVLVEREGRAVFDAGVGLRDRERELPNGPATVHAIGSITKQFTAAAVLALVERGKLNLRDTLGQLLPDVPADKAGITLHQLLTHSAGFIEAIGDDYETLGREAFLARALAAPLAFTPGTGYLYSNVGYSVLGALVELRSGQSYEAFLRGALFEPAGLAHTGYRMPDWEHSELAIGYDKRGRRWGTMLDHPQAADGPYWNLRCNGGLLSTTHDLRGWVRALADGKVLSATSVEAMFEPYVEEGPGAGSHYGYGWAIFTTPRGTKLITHNGGNGVQFADVLWYAEEDVFIALASNASPRGMQDVAWEIGRMCFDASYVPRPKQVLSVSKEPPSGPVGERMRALSRLCGSAPDDAALRVWLEQNLGPGFLSQVPMERHLAFFRQLCDDVGANDIEEVATLGPGAYTLLLRSRSGPGRVRVSLELRPEDSKIIGLGVDDA